METSPPLSGDNPQCRELLRLICRHEQAMGATFSEEQKAAFGKYHDCTQELHRLTELEAFICGFKLGGRLMLETAGTDAPAQAGVCP